MWKAGRQREQHKKARQEPCRAAQTGASQSGAGQQRRQDSEPAGSGGRDRDRQQTPGFPRGRAALGKRTLSQAGRARLRGSRPSPRLQASSSLDPSPSFPEKSQGSLFGFWFLNFITFAVALRLLVVQSRPTLCNPVDCSPPGSSVHGILQARILEWVAFHFSGGSSRPRDQTRISCIAGRFFTI